MVVIIDVFAWMLSRIIIDVMLGTGVNLLVYFLCGEDLIWFCFLCSFRCICRNVVFLVLDKFSVLIYKEYNF